MIMLVFFFMRNKKMRMLVENDDVLNNFVANREY